MGNKRTSQLAWALCELMTCLAAVLFGANLLRQTGSQNVFRLAVDVLFSLGIPVVFAIVAA